jgi:hypothetical protein
MEGNRERLANVRAENRKRLTTADEYAFDSMSTLTLY